MRLAKWLVAAAGLAALVAGVLAWRTGEGGTPPAVPPAPVAAPAEVVVEGRVVPVRQAALAFAAGGVVAEVRAVEGQEVQAGAVLARLRSERAAALVARAEAEVRRAEARLAELRAGPRPAELHRAEAAVAAARARLTQARTAGDAASVLAEAELRQAEAELQALRAGPRPELLAAAEAEAAAARAALDEARALLADAVLRAPFAGVVAAVAVRPGEYAPPGAVVVRLYDPSRWWVETVDLTQVDVVAVRPGQPARLRFDALPDVELRGRVVRVSPLGEERQGDVVYRVWVEPERPDPRLRWGMTAEVVIGR